jgi:hypothetical protein
MSHEDRSRDCLIVHLHLHILVSEMAENIVAQTYSMLARECLRSESRWRNSDKVQKKALEVCV